MRSVLTKVLRIAISVVAILFVIYRCFVCLASGFKWPSDYILTTTAISYRQGFLPRSLIGAIGYAIFGSNWYSWKYMTPVIIVVSAIFLCWMIYLIIKSGFNFRDPVLFGIVSIFVTSPFARYYIYEMGYYEQYGYLLVMLVLYLNRVKNVWCRYVMPAVAAFIAVLISESNLFLIIPILCAFSIMTITNEETEVKVIHKKTLIILATYIPTVAYSLIVWAVKVPKERMLAIQEYDRNMIENGFSYFNFNFRNDVHMYFCDDRSNADIWGRSLHPIHLWCVVLSLIVIVFVTYMIIENGKSTKLAVTYSVMSLAVGLAAYIIVIVAWDLERYALNIFVSVLFVSIFTITKFKIKTFKKKESLLVFTIVLIAAIGCVNERLSMFNSDYNKGIAELMEVIRQRISI